MPKASILPEWMEKWTRINPLCVWRTTNTTSRDAVAIELGVSYVSIRNYEMGLSSPAFGIQQRLAKIMGITLDELATEWNTWQARKATFFQPNGSAANGAEKLKPKPKSKAKAAAPAPPKPKPKAKPKSAPKSASV